MILGIHHVTAISSEPQLNVDFYSHRLGLRTIKQTVNFDDPTVYHLYYGDGIGTPGTLMTFFPYGDILKGERGVGEANITTLAIPEGSFGWWSEYLKDARREVLLGRDILALEDPDGLTIHLEETPDDGRTVQWENPNVPFEHAIRNIKRMRLQPHDRYSIGRFATTEQVLTEFMGGTEVDSDATTKRFQIGNSEVDVFRSPETEPRAKSSAGSIHHVAFRNADDAIHQQWHAKIVTEKFNVSPVVSRDYFHSLYFREPGGILFEFATDGPGFLIDEPLETVGTGLKLPSRYET
ncbi:MAG TPA: hypothetical protein VK171_02175, partial [Fimbriimonas sp.]|nr:hypothetical protein [Fimbriimonas sp.]